MHKFLRLVRRVCRKFKPNETSLQLCEVIQKLDFMPKIRSRVESHTLHFWDSATLWPARCRGPGNGRSEGKPFPRIVRESHMGVSRLGGNRSVGRSAILPRFGCATCWLVRCASITAAGLVLFVHDVHGWYSLLRFRNLVTWLTILLKVVVCVNAQQISCMLFGHQHIASYVYQISLHWFAFKCNGCLFAVASHTTTGKAWSANFDLLQCKGSGWFDGGLKVATIGLCVYSCIRHILVT